MWSNPSSKRVEWLGTISRREEKQAVARTIAAKVRDGDVIGAGSGSTALLTIEEIGRRVRDEGSRCKLIPTSREMEMAAGALGLTTTNLLNDKPAWCFDGADEVDPDGNLIKGRGGAMYREKLVISAADKVYILIDSTKRVQRLGEKFPVPVEILPEALHLVETSILHIPGVEKTKLRLAHGKDGPVITENGNFILDVRFSIIEPDTEKQIKSLTGVLESGLFWGFNPEIVES
jgi:ribose 5-phosphate isomerase A